MPVMEQISVDDILNSVDDTVSKFMEAQEEEVKLERAGNIIEWIIGKDFLKQPQLFEYKRQYQVLRDFFQLRCPLCNKTGEEWEDVWNKGQEYLESEVLLLWNEKDLDDTCPKCGWTRRELEDEELLLHYNTMVGCAGMRSGKSMSAAFIATWIEHNCLMVPSLQQYFDVIEKQRLEVAFVATTATQTKDTIFDTYTALRETSPWLIKAIERLEYRQRQNELYKEYSSGSVEYREKKLYWISLNSNSSGLAGRTRIAGFIDELSRFDLSESKRSADEIFSVINHSLLTVRAVAREKNLPNWIGLMVCVSSPISENDKTMQLLKVKSDTIYGFHYSTTEFNPKITQVDLQPEYDKDDIKAERDFGAKPPGTENPLIVRWDDWFQKCKVPGLRPKALFTPFYPVDSFGQQYTALTLDSISANKSYGYFLSIDAGKSGDSFAMAMGHGEDVEDDLGERFITVLDFVLHLKPSKTRLAYFKCVIEIIKGLQKKLKIGECQYDHWQSEPQIQELRDIGIWAQAYNLRAVDYENLMRDGYGGYLRLLPPLGDPINDDPKRMDAQTKYWWEARHLERSRDLRRVDHPDGGSNDLIQVVCGVHRLVSHSRTADGEDKKAKTKHMFKRFVGGVKTGRIGNVGMVTKGFSRWNVGFSKKGGWQ
jgi:hypothetical protein